jgi:hypothetical protein
MRLSRNVDECKPLLVGLCKTACIVIGQFSVDRFGRRLMMLSSIAAVTASLVGRCRLTLSNTRLKPPGTKPLKLKIDMLLLTSAFEFNLRRYSLVMLTACLGTGAAAGG